MNRYGEAQVQDSSQSICYKIHQVWMDYRSDSVLDGITSYCDGEVDTASRDNRLAPGRLNHFGATSVNQASVRHGVMIIGRTVIKRLYCEQVADLDRKKSLVHGKLNRMDVE